MKKSIIAVFSVSLTAGTVYLAYSQLKAYMIKKLIASWEKELKQQQKELTPDQQKRLEDELDKLYVWEVKCISAYWAKVQAKAPENELEYYLNKIKAKKIREKANLKTVDTLLFGT